VSRRSKQALGLAALALGCALIGALGPSESVRSTYSWPPADLPAGEPERLWYSPLLLARHEPESISVRIPCEPPPALGGADAPTTVLATTAEPAAQGGLAVTRDADTLTIAVGAQELTRLRLPAGRGDECVFGLLVDGREWLVEGGSATMADAGTLDARPRVDGLFSGLDLRADGAPSVAVTTVVHGSRTSILQKLAWVGAVLAAVAALVLVSGGRRPTLPTRRTVGAAARELGVLDLVVVLVLWVWWFVGPAFFDDGWVLARQRNYDVSGGFSAYYSSFGTNFPLDVWLEWLQHWVSESADALLVLRIPTFVCLLGLWILCRVVLRRVAGAAEDAFVRLALASAFLAATLAWGMTLRPEPVVALLAAGVLACTVRFLERGTIAPLAAAALLVVLALSAHPTGIVAIAPLLAAAPTLLRWARSRPNAIALATVAVAAVAVLGTLVTVGSNLEQRRAEASALRAYGDETAGWRDELTRYSQLSQAPYGAALRRGSVALLVLAVAAFLLRRRREPGDLLLDLPATTLGIALLLFLATPTKWPWHFGALIGLGAVAVAAETARLRLESAGAGRWDPRPYFAVLAAVAAAGWAWFPRLAWGDLDLRTMDWTLGLESRITLAKVAGALPVLVLVALALLTRTRRHQAPWQAAALTAPIVAVPLVAFTIGVLLTDLAKTESWTLTRQNLDAVTGDVGCGLADDVLVADRASLRALPTLTAAPALRADEEPAQAPAGRLPRFVLGPAPAPDAPAATPWFEVPTEGLVGVFYGGTPSPSDRLELEWGSSATGGISVLGGGGVPLDYGPDSRVDVSPWRFLPAGSLPARPEGANAVRFVLRSDPGPGGAVALTAPVTYENARLADVLEAEASPTLVLPNLATYFPCAELPAVSGGVAEPPRTLVGFTQTIWPVTGGTSPFDALPRLYPLTRFPLTDSPDPPGDVAVYVAEPRIDGGIQAPAERTVVAS
jgi:Mycobacterial cell wall arabinan synthesis protein/Arabinosyltransferase concanavalin like domain